MRGLPATRLLALLIVCAAAFVPTRSEGAPTQFNLRYRFNPGDMYTYETHTQVTGTMGLTLNGKPEPTGAPVGLEISDTTRYEVKSIENGEAVLSVRLLTLAVTPTEPGWIKLELEREGEETIVTGGTVDHVRAPSPETGKPTPKAVTEPFNGWNPVSLMSAYEMRITPAGQIRITFGKTWMERLTSLSQFAPLAAYLQPFGAALPELPGRGLEQNQEWEQSRQLPLPGTGTGNAADDKYGLDVLYSVEGKQALGDLQTAKVGFEGSVAVQNKPIKLAVPGSGVMEMTLETLTHHLRGNLAFECEHGFLAEQSLKSEVNSVCVGGPNKSIRIESGVKVDASVLLIG